MQFTITVKNSTTQALTQKLFLYIEGQKNTAAVKKLAIGESEDIVFEKHPSDTKIMLSYLNTESAIIIKAIGDINNISRRNLEIQDITPQGTVKYSFT
ncbi:hypothetical protein HCA00_06855 [Listeria booriae]|uniref:hypothetical protein n=1 Tax=Listeria booriae TaxID=1552123 RepID=UPI001624ADCA|nr:hypothetical protein [Listeria booriae]MBC1292455.1 hypothetical protein [Listeria booriae]MBC1334832.1 hypothetical protein [Listeria booriae]MBC1651624.1 hypothetical protein [Listeria booriae]MBC1943704.1 hypothetical protein [Listeria booriae]MBC6128509.1 hypothetical protein [Listeria booriae]